MNWIDKLHPARFSDMSPRMAAIVGCICEKQYTNPSISSITVTSDAHLIVNGDYFGVLSDLRKNWENLLDSAGLTKTERVKAQKAFDKHVVDDYKNCPTRAIISWA